MRIRSKLIVLIAVPLAALGLAAAFGFSNQSAEIDKAEDAVAASRETRAVYQAVLAIGDERLFRVGGEVGRFAELTENTDVALEAIGPVAGSAATRDAVSTAKSLVEQSRNTSDADFAQDLLGAAGQLLLTFEIDRAGDYPNAELRNASVVNRLSIETLQLREWAWLGYLRAGDTRPETAAAISADFATADASRTNTLSIESDGESNAVATLQQSEVARQLAALEAVALDDLNEGRLTVTEDDVLEVLSESRRQWNITIGDQADLLLNSIEDELRSANDLRSLFALLASVGVFVLVGLIFVVYRSITNPLGALLERASSVAEHELPALVDALRHDDGSADLPTAEAIPVTTDDEIGELVTAFNDVQATAYDLATEQALSRRNVADMFVNLGRRNQQLLQRILAQLTELEQNEEDPDKLKDLFDLDNVVTRMRRNAESLLALAGAQTARQWTNPIAIDNTVRAAFGEVEGYERIEMAELDDTKVMGSVVADVTHLLAELLENAINFSEPHTSVVVSGRDGGDGYHIAVEDQGIGMSQRELIENNHRITDPPPLDQVPTRFLGLYVVGRLAERHGIQVRLAETSGGGISAKVILPPNLVVDEKAERARAVAALSEQSDTSPLEEDHDLDAELAEITAEAAEDHFDSNDDQVDDEYGDDDGDDGSLSGGGSNDDPDALPVRSTGRASATAVAEVTPDVANEIDADPDFEQEVEQQVEQGVEHEDDVEPESAPAAEADDDDADQKLPQRGRKSRRRNKGAKTEKKQTAAAAEAEVVADQTELDEAPTHRAIDDHETVSDQDAVSDEDAVEQDSSDEPVDQPESDGGLPVRNKGGALQQSTTLMERATVEDRAPTDSSEEAAGSFSSMMSALSSGVARGLEDSDNDESTEGNDK